MKCRHIYTVIREFKARDLKEAQDFFGAVRDETGEFLLGGDGEDEKIGVELQAKVKGKWVSIDKKEPET